MGVASRHGGFILIVTEAGDQTLGRSEQSLGDDAGDVDERLQGPVYRVRPCLEVAGPSGLANLWRSVFPVVTGQIQVGDVQQWATPVLHIANRSEEHTSELQSLRHLVCR